MHDPLLKRLTQQLILYVVNNPFTFTKKYFASKTVVDGNRGKWEVFPRVVHKGNGVRRLAGEHDVPDPRAYGLRKKVKFFAHLHQQRFGFLLDGEENVGAKSADEDSDEEQEDLEFDASLDRAEQICPLFWPKECRLQEQNIADFSPRIKEIPEFLRRD